MDVRTFLPPDEPVGPDPALVAERRTDLTLEQFMVATERA